MEPTTRGAGAGSGTAAGPTHGEAIAGLVRCLGPYAVALLDRTAQPFVFVHGDGTILRANRAFEELLGYGPGALEGRPIVAITPERWHRTTLSARTRISAEGRPLRYEKEYIARDGGIVPVDLVADVLRDEEGRMLGLFSFITDLSERKITERALRESEARFRHLFDEAPFGYHEIDTEGRITAINRAECEMLGYRRDELIGRPIVELVDESRREDARAAVAEKLAGRRPLVPIERPYRRRDGQRIIVSIRERLRVDDEGRILGIRSTMQDVTEQKAMEAELIASQRRLQALFDGIEDAVFVHDLDGTILEANPAASRLLGYRRDELIGMKTSEIDAEDFAEGFRERLERQLREGHFSCEGRHRTRDGRVVPVEIQTSTITLGDETAVLAAFRDVTERKALEETRRQFAEAQARNAEVLSETNRRLRESEAQYRQLTEATLDAVVVADSHGRIVLFNPAAERTFGYEAAEVTGRPLSMILIEPGGFGGDDCDCDDGCACARPAMRLVGRTVELKGRRKDGEEFPLELSLNAVVRDREVQYIGSIRDLTERQRMRDVLVQSEKLASIGLLSAGVAHEINNPLAYVANNLAVLERDLGGLFELVACYEAAEPRLREADPSAIAVAERIKDELDWTYVRENLPRLIGRTREGVQRVASIVQNLRGMARTAPPKKESVPLAELVTSSLEITQGQLRKAKIRAEPDLPAGLRRVPCVASQISQVLINLIINAAQAIQKAGRPEGGTIRVALRDEGAFQILEVTDDGVGIPPEDLPRLFDPFFTTKPIGEGTGLGLAISHGIVTGHGGTIRVASRPGVGSTFRVELPVGG